MEEDYDLSDVDLDDDFEKDELWAQMGRDLSQTYLFGSGLVPRDPPLLSCGRMGGLVAQLLKYPRKDTWETPAVSHNIFVSHTGTGGRGVCVVSLQWTLPQRTCWTLDAAYLYGCRQLRRGGRRFRMWHFNLFFLNIVPSSAFPKHIF